MLETVEMWSWLSTERGRPKARKRMTRDKKNREHMKQKVLEGRMVDQEGITGSDSPISDWRPSDVFILVLLR